MTRSLKGSLIVSGLWGLVTFASFFSGAVDVWAQTVLHIGCVFLAAIAWLPDDSVSPPLLPATGLWIALLIVLAGSTLQSGSPTRSVHEFQLWIDYLLIFH